jgi:myo-inositol 2-dehydrogenase/D-chiro-inositol 1-dehydrogenase
VRREEVSLAVYDTDSGLAREVAAALGARVASSFRELVQMGLDGLVISTPTQSHGELLRVALEARIPVFCEKPVSATIAEGIALVGLAERSGVPIQVGLQRRSDPGLVALRSRLRSGRHGPLIGIRVVSSSWRPPSRDYLQASGGVFTDKVVHEVDLVRYVTGLEIEQVTASASGSAAGWIGEMDDADTVSAGLILSGGVVGQIWVARMAPSRFDLRVEAVCRERLLVAGSWDHGAPSSLEWAPSPWPDFVSRFADAYRAEIEAFLLLVAGNGQNVCPARDALRSELIAVAVEQAWRDERSVRIEEFAHPDGYPSSGVRPGRMSDHGEKEAPVQPRRGRG